ncbi:MAG: undecaprenyl-diphosphate phosphatase [Ndongobacter sp.]|nr:undecaprenyl-diphosphate phosphatase [Ndongobacter sp.]
MDILKVLLLSFVEGITEFLPISSTGHLILFNEFVQLEPAHFANAFNIIIQLGAILSVVVVFFHKLNPFDRSRTARALPARYDEWNTQTRFYYRLTHYDRSTMQLWGKVIVGVLPAVVLGLLFDDFIDAHLMNAPVVIAMLLIYGVVILQLEGRNAGRKTFRFPTADDLTYRTAFLIGLFQCLAMVPGTSRSAATIIGAMLLGASRVAAAEFSFYLAIPTMLGATFLKVLKNLGGFSMGQWLLILLGFVVSFLVAYVVIQKFLQFIHRHDFRIFGYYRIALALVVGLYYLFF